MGARIEGRCYWDSESGSGELFLSVFPLLEFSATFSFLFREFSFSLFGEFFFSDFLLDGRPLGAYVS